MSIIEYEVRDSVAEIRLNNPPINALDEAMVDALLAALDRARDDSTARAVILGSTLERRFCAGLDLELVTSGSPSDLHALVEKLYVRLYDAQYHLGKPSIAAVNGSARGGGMTLVVSCDLIIAAATSTFGYPEIDVGLLPAIHFTHLPRIVGRHRAFDLLFTGRPFTAGEARDLGLVNRVVSEDDVLDEARKLAQVLCEKPPGIMRRGKAAFMHAIDQDYRRGIAGAVETICGVAATEESREGIAAFVEKRKPAWKPT